MTALFVQLGAASFLVPPRSWPLGAYRTPETLTRLQHFASVRYASMGYSRRHASAGIGPTGVGDPDHRSNHLQTPTIRLHSFRVNRQIGILLVDRSRVGARAGRAVQHSFFVQWAALTSRVTRLLQLPNRLPWAPSAVGHVAHELASANNRQRVVKGRFACSSAAPPRSKKMFSAPHPLSAVVVLLRCRSRDFRCGPRGFLGICFVVDPQPGRGHRTPHASGRSPLLPARRTIKRQRIGFRVS